ncbi:MAG: hypothetical protein PHC86_04545, partial [Eubacteriales bacterium]|nr:hypothetical protein [Eubacteriales bacterium]
CPQCGQQFAAQSQQKQAFCVHCGTLIDRSSEPEVIAAAARRVDHSAIAKAREMFQEIRFPIVDKKTGMKGDRLIELWTLLVFHSRNSRSAWSTRTAYKEIGGFFERKIWRPAFDLAGQYREQLIIDQLLESAVVYLTTCRDDSRFGSKLMGVVRLSAEAVAEKSAEEICKSMISFLMHLNQPGESAAIIHAIIMAYPRVFSAHRQVLADVMQTNLTDEERQEALKIVARIAELNRH